MKRLLGLVLCLGSICGWSALAQTGVLAQVDRLETRGQFKQAAEVLKTTLHDLSMPDAERKTLEFELDRLQRIRKDFPYTKAELFAQLKQSVKGLTPAEFEQWASEGRFDSREIDGHLYFMGSSVSNLYFRYPELNARRLGLKDPAPLQKAMWEACVAIRQAAQAEKKPYVLPKRFHVTMTVTAQSNAAPAGEIIRAWLPIPRRYPFQNEFEVVSSSSPLQHLAEEQSPIRCAYLEQPATKNQPVNFRIEYTYTIQGVSFAIKPEEVHPTDPNNSALAPFTREGPHVVFTPEIRALSQQIVGTETNPCLRAKRFYDWIGEHIKYSYALEYSTIRNIGDYCRTKAYGDCGQEALLFITLCRLNGIPARWQSGWNLFPGATTIHDWTEIYLAPYGWVPVDPYMSIYATRYANTLTAEQKRELRDFYFGGLDQYRMAANSDHNQSLQPPKQSMRSDPVDFQRGELETGGHNLYFDQYTYDLKWTEIKPPGQTE